MERIPSRNPPNADDFGVYIFDFRVSNRNVPCFEWSAITDRLRERGTQPRKCKPHTDEKQKNVVILHREMNIYGELVDKGIEPLGQEWTEQIPFSIMQNIRELSTASLKLSLVQYWALTMIIYDYPGIIYCGGGYKVRETIYIGVASRVTTISNSLYTSVYQDYRYDNRLKEFRKDSEELPVRRPISILFCHSKRSAENATENFKWLFKKTDVSWEHIFTGKVNEATGTTKKFGELLIGTAENIMIYLKKYNIPMDRLESIFILSADVYSPGSKKEKLLKKGLEYIKKYGGREFLTYLHYRKFSDVTPFLESLLPTNYSVINMPKKENYHPPSIKICLCNQEENQPGFMQKLAYLYAIVNKVYENDDRRANKATLVICRKPETAIMLSAFLSIRLKIVFSVITNDMDAIHVERVKNLFRSRATDFLITDHYSVGHVEPGFIATTILFDLPNIQRFDQRMFRLTDLSAKIQTQNNRQLFLFVDPQTDSEFIAPIHEFLESIGERIPQTLHAMYESLMESKRST